jgi:hypothetical protein
MRCKLRTCQPEVTSNLNGNPRRTRSDGEVIVRRGPRTEWTSNFGLAPRDFLLLPQLKEHLTTSLVKLRSQDRCENANPSRRYKPYFVVLMKLPEIWKKCVILLRREHKIAEQISGILFDLKTIERNII